MEKEPKNKMDTKKEYLYAYILATSSWKRKTVIRIRLQHQEIRVSEYYGGKFFRKSAGSHFVGCLLFLLS